VRFKELTYDLAEVMYEHPFRIPANFTYIIRAIMTLEGMGIAMDPNFSFFDVAKPYAKEFMLKREGRFIRDQVVKRLSMVMVARSSGVKPGSWRRWRSRCTTTPLSRAFLHQATRR
jgi:predicted unusual protein kinase regulating ubiquinone biosynthesis (AarF/ABC1/UbiB family)